MFDFDFTLLTLVINYKQCLVIWVSWDSKKLTFCICSVHKPLSQDIMI